MSIAKASFEMNVGACRGLCFGNSHEARNNSQTNYTTKTNIKSSDWLKTGNRVATPWNLTIMKDGNVVYKACAQFMNWGSSHNHQDPWDGGISRMFIFKVPVGVYPQGNWMQLVYPKMVFFTGTVQWFLGFPWLPPKMVAPNVFASKHCTLRLIP